MASLKNGEVTVGLKEEEVVWKDKKRRTIFALPISFTTYKLTQSRLFIETGLLKKTENEIRLYRIRDIQYTQSLGERIGNAGTVTLISTDATEPEIKLLHIKGAKNIKNIISQLIEQARLKNGVRTSELMGSGHAPGEPIFGPELFPDHDHDGVDDRLQ